MLKHKWWLGLGLLLSMGSQALLAYELVFSSVSFVPSDKKNSISILVRNTGESPQAVEFDVKGMEFNEDYEESNPAIPEDWFKISPSGIIIDPGNEEVVKITWANKNEVKKETPFRLMVKELDITEPDKDADPDKEKDSKEPKVKVKTLFNQIRFMSVMPNNPESNVSVLSSKLVMDEDKPVAHVVLSNSGNIRHSLENKSILIKSKTNEGVSYKYPVSTFSLYPQFNRKMAISLPEEFKGDEIVATIVDQVAD